MVYANAKTKRAHSSRRNDRCRASEIKRSNLRRFNTIEDAEADGYVRCKHCYSVKEESK